MTRLMLISPQGNNLLRDNDGSSIIADFGDNLHILTDRGSVALHQRLSNGTVQGLRLNDFKSARTLFEAIVDEHARKPFTCVGLIDEALMEVAAELRQMLGLPGLAPQIALRFRDKTEMKRLLGNAGLRVPAYRHDATRDNVASLLAEHDRLVIKERKGYGSRGVTFIDDLAGYDRWAKRERHPEAFEVEEFISAPLYNVNAVVLHGKLAFVAVVYNRPGMADVDFSSGAPFVSHILAPGPQHNAFAAYASRVRDTLELDNGVIHLECFLKKTGEIVFCEVAARPGGGGVMRLIEAQFGLNMARAALQIEMGVREAVLLPMRHRAEMACFIGFRNAGSGFVRAIPQAGALERRWVDRIVFRKSEGEFAAPAAHCTDFVAHIDFHATNVTDFGVRADELNAAFSGGFELSLS